MARRKILMLVGDDVEDYQAMIPLQALQMIGHEVHAVCPGKHRGDLVRTIIYDLSDVPSASGKPGHSFAINANFSDTRAEDYDALVIPGGRAPATLRLDTDVIELVRAFALANKPIAAVCHGPQLLAAAGVLKGKLCTAHPAVRAEIERAGARWAAPNAERTNADVDNNLVTAPSWAAHPQWIAKLTTLLGSHIKV